MARRPREPSALLKTSATSTKSVMMSAVKNSEIAAAATMAMVMESSIVIRRAARFSAASLKIGQPPITMPRMPSRLMLVKRLPQIATNRKRGERHHGDASRPDPTKGVRRSQAPRLREDYRQAAARSKRRATFHT